MMSISLLRAIRFRFKPIQLKRFFTTTRPCCEESALNVNTNVIKDVILFKYENPRFYKVLNVFAVCQFGFWSYLSIFSYTSLRDSPRRSDEDTPWYLSINLGDNKFRNTIAASTFAIGFGILAISWMYTLRSVRYLILRKGGNQVTLVTYGPFGNNRMFTAPLQEINCKEMRTAARSQLPMKVNNHYLHYILDMKGEFRNTSLFDHTAGMRRQFK